MWIAVLLSAALAQNESPVLDAARERFRTDLLIEGAGVFWLVAELAILYAVTVGGRALRERPLPGRLVLTSRERWIAAALALLSAGLIALVCARFLLAPALPEAVEAAALETSGVADAVYAAVVRHIQVHLVIWCTFIAGWVVLESLIVIQGIRAFHALARVIGAAPARMSTAAAATVVFAAAVLVAPEAAAHFSRAVETHLQHGFSEALTDARPGYRFVEFYLRVAGAVWASVEWIAALYLFRGYLMLRRFFRERVHVA